MKAHVSKLLMTVVLGAVVLLGTGCNQDMTTAMWWLPNPWTPVFFSTSSSSLSGSGGAAATGGGGSSFNTGGGYNVGGGVPGLGM